MDAPSGCQGGTGRIVRFAGTWAGASCRFQSETPAGRRTAHRDALLATSRAVFARLGTDVPLEVVAQEAGVGRGTLYRHFPSREHVLAAIMRDNAAVLEEKARELIEAPELSDGVATSRPLRRSP
jgi:AcrR family transcriptional regulator